MKIQIIGLGVVGKAQAYLMHSLNHYVYGYDIKKGVEENYYKIIDNISNDVDITFICTPEIEVESVIKQLVDSKHKGLIVIKSTTKPKTTELLMQKYNVHICHNPEFLREKFTRFDVMNPSRIIIGKCCYDHSLILLNLYKPLNVSTYITDPTTSELAKITVNALRATIITFWNQINKLAISLNIDTNKLAEIVDTAKSIGKYEGGNWGTKAELFGKPYGGKCLPKDIKQLISTFKEVQIEDILFTTVADINNKLNAKQVDKYD